MVGRYVRKSDYPGWFYFASKDCKYIYLCKSYRTNWLDMRYYRDWNIGNSKVKDEIYELDVRDEDTNGCYNTPNKQSRIYPHELQRYVRSYSKIGDYCFNEYVDTNDPDNSKI
ncbi:hypothetical protein PIROE2DRAFT_17987 [Piromyces sp. E2]|nr:hypothetical protein PIROE2DRAFT_17987 [Piromyces sp. E2]|eukprot:OUM57124.1 hypothetical protein PIROE2DRAFT_17987 [Piromyces sp. E2]